MARTAACGRRFCLIEFAPETLACLVMDCLTTTQQIRWPPDEENAGKDKEKELEEKAVVTFPAQFDDCQKEDIVKEFQALHALAFKHAWTKKERTQFSKWAPRTLLPEIRSWCRIPRFTFAGTLNCAIFCAKPYLTLRLNVCGLPGRGYRGDWYLHIEPGSVSQSLGASIAKDLTDPSEDYERFRRGLSLPVKENALAHCLRGPEHLPR